MSHAENARSFVSDSAKAHWHDEALWFVRRKRDAAAGSLPEWEELRRAAQSIKSHTLEHLGYYLKLFEANAAANGIDLYWAADAREHNRIVAKLLKESGAEKVVKSKSMLTEECGLNPWLEKEGIEVTDTDLGERIVQLAGERPSHIVLPAIHLKKEDVSGIFARHLGTESGNSDPEYLTRAARKHLREKFLNADAAITGVNFALAKEGGIVLCTNEGNVDLGTSLPDLHIACMGLEKVIPSAGELAVFIRLLARSATGQAVTAYTSHFIRPTAGRRLAVVIVDNGRSALLRSGHAELLRCIRCGACMNSCPVYRRSGGHSYGTVVPGPIGSALAGARDIQVGSSLPFACTLCASCDNVCPVRIGLHSHLYKEREEAIAQPAHRAKRVVLKAAAFILKRSYLYRSALILYKIALRYLPRPLIYNRFNIWGRSREMPSPAPRSFSRMMRERERK